MSGCDILQPVFETPKVKSAESLTLPSVHDRFRVISSNFSTTTPTAEDMDCTLKEGSSTEAVNTITEEDNVSSHNSTPTAAEEMDSNLKEGSSTETVNMEPGVILGIQPVQPLPLDVTSQLSITK